jgi:hypothetical protein
MIGWKGGAVCQLECFKGRAARKILRIWGGINWIFKRVGVANNLWNKEVVGHLLLFNWNFESIQLERTEAPLDRQWDRVDAAWITHPELGHDHPQLISDPASCQKKRQRLLTMSRSMLIKSKYWEVPAWWREIVFYNSSVWMLNISLDVRFDDFGN